MKPNHLKQISKENSISVERAREVVSYDPITGVMTKAGGVIVGGKQRASRYGQVRIDGAIFMSHRLAFFLHHGRWPVGVVDHKNGDTNDNRIENLREAAQSQNLGNMRTPKHNKSGIKGVYWDAGRRKWQAQIQINRHSTSLGRFQTKEEAAAAYRDAAQRHFGEFARV